MNASTVSPYHEGEHYLQSLTGLRDKMEAVGRRVIRELLTDEQQSFFNALSMLYICSFDDDGLPCAQVVSGTAGFISADDHQLTLDLKRVTGGNQLVFSRENNSVGILGLIHDQRKRVRLNGEVTIQQDDTLIIKVVQAFGNCPKYIQARKVLAPILNDQYAVPEVMKLKRLDQTLKGLVEQVDTFFIGSYYMPQGLKKGQGSRDAVASHGVDMSHRGGKPGFISVIDDETLNWPEYSGNFAFNTLGNLMQNPVCSLLFIDFGTGDVLQLVGRTNLNTDTIANGNPVKATVEFKLDSGVYSKQSLPYQWEFMDYSPMLEKL